VALLAALVVATGLSGSTETASASVGTASGGPQRIIIDTDLSLLWDDATAVGMANVLQQRDKVHILGVMSDIRNPVAAAALDAIDTAYGQARIPVGAVADSAANSAPHGYSDVLAQQLPVPLGTVRRRKRRSISIAGCWRPNRTTASRSSPAAARPTWHSSCDPVRAKAVLFWDGRWLRTRSRGS
jgi:hypothetical protein